MFNSVKIWFSTTKKDFKDFAIRQADVLTVIVLLFISSYVAAHFIVLYSEPYAITETYIKSNPAIVELAGDINSVFLEPMANSIKWQSSGGWAELEVGVGGSKSNLKVRSYLERKEGTWTLLKAHALLPNHDVIPLKQ